MARPSIVPEILEKLEPWLEARMGEFESQLETRREPSLPSTVEGKINVRELTLALGLKRSQEQHFFNHNELRTLVNAAAQAQGLAPLFQALKVARQLFAKLYTPLIKGIDAPEHALGKDFVFIKCQQRAEVVCVQARQHD